LGLKASGQGTSFKVLHRLRRVEQGTGERKAGQGSARERIEIITKEIDEINQRETSCQRLMSIPGHGTAWCI
jgi:hypothetical protein